MAFRIAFALGLGLVIGLAGCGSNTGASLVTDGDLQLLGFSDEFDDQSTISKWLVRAAYEGDPSDGSVSMNGGQLLLRPSQDRYFLDDHRGLSLFKTLKSDLTPRFVIETRVTAVDPATGGAPTEAFHSAGLNSAPDG